MRKYHNIYRIQNKYNKGPYQTSAFINCGFQHYDIKHPTPTDGMETDDISVFEIVLRERGYKQKNLMLFGFANKKQMLAWFTRGQIKKMYIKYNMSVHKYRIETDRILFGNKQVVFYSGDAISELVPMESL